MICVSKELSAPHLFNKMKQIILIAFLVIFCLTCVESMTEAQMKSTSKLMRNVCQPKTKATNEQIDNMHKGIFEEDDKPKCYMLCVLNMMKVLKNGKVDYEFSLGQVRTLPPRYKEPTTVTLEKCKDAANNPNFCQAAYDLAQCMYFSNPEFYFLP